MKLYISLKNLYHKSCWIHVIFLKIENSWNWILIRIIEWKEWFEKYIIRTSNNIVIFSLYMPWYHPSINTWPGCDYSEEGNEKRQMTRVDSIYLFSSKRSDLALSFSLPHFNLVKPIVYFSDVRCSLSSLILYLIISYSIGLLGTNWATRWYLVSDICPADWIRPLYHQNNQSTFIFPVFHDFKNHSRLDTKNCQAHYLLFV